MTPRNRWQIREEMTNTLEETLDDVFLDPPHRRAIIDRIGELLEEIYDLGATEAIDDVLDRVKALRVGRGR